MKTKRRIVGVSIGGHLMTEPDQGGRPGMQASIKSLGEHKEIDISGKPTMVINLSDGGQVEVELFERTTGRLTVRTSEGCIIVHPLVSNVIEVESQYKKPVAR